MKITVWDIEASSLNASFGMLLTVCCGDVGEKKIDSYNLLDYKRRGETIFDAERKLLIDVSARLLEADVWLGWYSKKYDLPFVQSRLIKHHLPILPHNFPHIDGWMTAKYRLKLPSNRLATVQDFLGVEHSKTKIDPDSWLLAMSGDKEAMEVILHHNKLDIEVLREVYDRIKPLITDHPHRGLVGPAVECGICASSRMQRRGFHLTRTRKYQRYQCQECGAWTRGTKPVMIVSNMVKDSKRKETAA